MTKKPSRKDVSAQRLKTWKRYRVTVDLSAGNQAMAESFAAVMANDEHNPDQRNKIVGVVPIERSQTTVVHTDGGCDLKRGGMGAWAFVIDRPDGTREEDSNWEAPTTNNRMEMTAVIRVLAYLTPGPPVEIVADSQYVIKGVTEWRRGWVSRGWINATGKAVANRDLWERLYDLWDKHNVRFTHVRGHSGVVDNERCDFLCTQAMREGFKNIRDGA